LLLLATHPGNSYLEVFTEFSKQEIRMKTTVANPTLADVLDQHTRLAAPMLCHVEEDRLRCLACGHRCLIGEGQRGICKVRFNDHGELKVPFGYVAGLQSDPVEKKPFFHVYPGSDALTFGMMGCDLHCSYCQNWVTSQALRDAAAVAPIRPVTPGQLIDVARREGSRLVVSSYNEPLITAEWAVAVFREAKAAGLACAFVSNGNATPEVLDFLRPWIVSYKIDLKTFSDRNYRKLGGTLENITSTVRMVHERGIWLEIVTLVVPGFNDSKEELRDIARFLVSISPDIPWHVTAFHQDYRMTDPDPTSAETLMGAAEIGAQEGLRYIYAGNLPGRVGPWENTRCPSCSTTVIERFGYLIRGYHLDAEGRCPACRTLLPGVWPGTAAEVKTGNDMSAFRNRLPRPVQLAAERLSVGSRREKQASQADMRQDRRAGLPMIEKPQAYGGAQTMATAETMARVSGKIDLSENQKQQIMTATANMLRGIVFGDPPLFPAELTEVRDLPLSGAFVSLKRGRHLRSCCGLIGAPISLAQAIERAADRAIWEDERFPVVSPSELDHLQMEIWLLFNPERVPAQGEDRAHAITIGRHGIKVINGQASGLFLPSVAVENEWDAHRFLSQVCLKAGLPATAWKDDATALFTFEGEVLRTELAGPDGPKPMPRLAGPCRPEDLSTFAELCRANLYALLAGATPRYFGGAPDGTATGILLLLHQPNRGETRTFSRVSVRPGLPMQATLFALVQSAAQYLASQGIPPQALELIQIGLAFLSDPVTHGTVSDPQLGGFDPRHRALLVMERNKVGLMFDPGQAAAKLVEEAARQARVSHPKAAALFSLDVVTNVNRVSFSAVPGAVRGPAVRPAAVAGAFYEADPAALAHTVDELLAGETPAEPWPAAMVPHAGLRFSGRIVADVLKRIKIPSTVIVIGPKHTPHGVDWAVAPQQTWSIPGVEIASDFILARRLCQAIPGLELDAAAHQREHAIEVELPFLARLAPQAKVVGIAIGQGDLESCRRFARGLADVLRSREERPLLVISSDMNHFATDAETRRLDEMALAALDKADPQALYDAVNEHNISMCGVLPAVIVLETLRELGILNQGKRVGYATSADVTGDPSRVVGYAGMLFG
jgi:AmmeMemoRadiSam system radical SAM enzyme/AmmeMemoRadiSam system protein B/AmmeMemoRadiSam system protein A